MHHENEDDNENDDNNNENDIPIISSKSKFTSSQGFSRSRRSSISSIRRAHWKKKIAKFVDSAPVLIFMSIITIYALFSADIQAAWLRIEVDYAFNVIQCLLVAIFSLEWILNIISKIDYLWSFFFWLDFIATVSLIQDIDWVMNPILGYGSARQKSYKSSVQAAKAMSKVSSASRATRVLRVIRIVRLIRMVKLYKSVVTARENQEKLKKKERELEEMKKKEKISSDDVTKKDSSSYIRGYRSDGSSTGKDSAGDLESIGINGNDGNLNSENGGNGIQGNKNNDNVIVIDKKNEKNGVQKGNDVKKDEVKNKKNNEKNTVDGKKNEKNNEDKNKKDDKKNEVDGKKNDKNEINKNKKNVNDMKKEDMVLSPRETERNGTEGNNLILNSNNVSNLFRTTAMTGENFIHKKEEGENKVLEKSKLSKSKESKETSSIGDLDEEDLEKYVKESKISKIISDSLTQKVILLILILLIVFPLLSDDFYASDSSVTYELVAQIISASYDLFQANNRILSKNILEQIFDTKFPALNITYNGTLIYNHSTLNNNLDYFRYKEVKTVFSANGQVSVVYSVLKETKLTGLLNIFQTIFVCIMLSGAAILFENDARNLVLGPLEIMIEIVENVAKDPINAKNVENLQTGVKAMLDQGEEQNKSKDKGNEEEENYEVSVIKAAIIKISALLAISFGEAGGEIIKKNITS